MKTGGYDDFAWLYDRRWGDISLSFLPAFDRLVLSALPPGSRVLDLACGTGQLAAALLTRGFRVTGLDSSAAMLRLAEHRAPGAAFVHADARSFDLAGRFDAAVSAFDSLNHMLSMDDLVAVFACVRKALAFRGRFVFDLNTEQAVGDAWSDAIVEPDQVAFVASDYDTSSRSVRFRAVMFRPRGEEWQRTDVELFQRCHRQDEVLAALSSTGFVDMTVTPSEAFDLRPGRLFYAADSDG